MDETCWAWPFWKFGLKSDDLNTTLHDRFNTVPSAIQDPEAFHHDVYELSTEANTLDEFERLMEERKKLRLEELNGMLENASFEIIGNPSLIGTEQWQYALQLFRTKSLDSLVRYFASYLPQGHPWHHDFDPAVRSSKKHEGVLDCNGPIMFDEPEEDEDLYTEESSSFTTADVSCNQPARSMTVRSEDSGVSVTGRDHHKSHDNHTSEPAMSFFESEPDHIPTSLEGSIPSLHEYEGTSQSDDPETPSTSISDLSEVDESHRKDMLVTTVVEEDDYMSITHGQPQTTDLIESEAPTPKPMSAGPAAAPAASFFDTKLSSLRSHSLSVNYSHPHHAHDAPRHYRKNHSTVRQERRRDCGLDRKRTRYGSRGISRTNKALHWVRQRGRKHVGV
ncbi:hypothetical protein VP1G_03221 [Cytospora mali]|uniref:Uncharacterized protein n=1 Tax=Cytospora mali TaxID=578113 RepID=A0A194UVV9_CYTMA|nr:hypothetical protein VP1G_03221 [Valsa mali var. pyri (nom. inval.)]